MVPSKASAAMATVSDRVGWGWIVKPMSPAVGAHLDGVGGFGDEVAGVGADDPGADDALGGLVEQHLGQALVAAQGQGAARRHPGEDAFAVFDSGGFGFVLGDPDPGDFGVGVGHRGDDGGVEVGVVAGAVLGGDLAFVGGLVGEHGLADDVADGEDVGDVGALLLVDRDETAFVDEHPRRVGADHLAVGAAADGDQDLVERRRLRGLGLVLAGGGVEGDGQPVRAGGRRW